MKVAVMFVLVIAGCAYANTDVEESTYSGVEVKIDIFKCATLAVSQIINCIGKTGVDLAKCLFNTVAAFVKCLVNQSDADAVRALKAGLDDLIAAMKDYDDKSSSSPNYKQSSGTLNSVDATKTAVPSYPWMRNLAG